jgi:hypothetical protein
MSASINDLFRAWLLRQLDLTESDLSTNDLSVLVFSDDSPSSAVTSVAGRTGDIVLTVADVSGAAADTAVVKITTNQSILGTKTFSGPVVINNAFVTGVSSINASQTLNSSSKPVQLCTPGADMVVTLPTGTSPQPFLIKNMSAHVVTVSPPAGGTIDGSTTGFALTAQYSFAEFVANPLSANTYVIIRKG